MPFAGFFVPRRRLACLLRIANVYLKIVCDFDGAEAAGNNRVVHGDATLQHSISVKCGCTGANSTMTQ